MPKHPITQAGQQQDLLSSTSQSPTTEQLILALHHLDTDGKETICAIILRTAKAAAWFKRAMLSALQQQLDDDRALDAWIEAEEQRHADPYTCSKEGDAAYWAAGTPTQPLRQPT